MKRKVAIEKREMIEWLNYWIEDANIDKMRIILLGDSVTRELRKKLNFFMRGNYAVDLIAMSYSILDDMAFEEIKHYFQTTVYNYDFIIFQIGGHHGYCIECAKSVEDTKKFEFRITEILEFLKQYSQNVIVIPITLENSDGKNVLNHNEEIQKRNQILKMVSKKLNLPFKDLNQKIDYKKMKYSDWCHFYEEGYEYISKLIMKEIFPDMKFALSNLIGTIQEFDIKLRNYNKKKIYIYGNGVRGNYIKKFLQKQNYRFDGFVVSDEYAGSTDTVTIHQIKKEDALFIVTPTDITIFEKLTQEKREYISLSSDIYSFLIMYDSIK